MAVPEGVTVTDFLCIAISYCTSEQQAKRTRISYTTTAACSSLLDLYETHHHAVLSQRPQGGHEEVVADANDRPLHSVRLRSSLLLILLAGGPRDDGDLGPNSTENFFC